MELFHNAKAVRLKCRHDKYLLADEDELHVTQDRDGSSPNARWTVELIAHDRGEPTLIRLRSRYDRFLTASDEPFLLGATGRKVLQTVPDRFDSSVEWEPVREGFQVRLKTLHGNYLRANGGVPPWRNSVTHDHPHRSSSQEWALWDVEIVQALTLRSDVPTPAPVPAPVLHPPPPPYPQLSKLESSDSFSVPLDKVEGRAIHYHIADDNGNVDESIESHSFTFNGSNLEQLTHKLEEETGLGGIIICSRNPINGKFYPLHLQLPPNNATMHVVIMKESSKVAKTFPWPYNSELDS